MKNKLFLLTLLFLSGCSTYRSTWNCPLEKGIGCSSIQYADEIAKLEIQSNSNAETDVYINDDYFDYEQVQE
jgi:hypothetical protein